MRVEVLGLKSEVISLTKPNIYILIVGRLRARESKY